MRRTPPCLFLLLALAWLQAGAQAQDFLPLDHSLRYEGKAGGKPVTVELTLRERPDGSFEYVEWVTPRSWAGWIGRATVVRTRLGYREDRLVPLGVDAGQGFETPPGDLDPAALDPLGVRLRARGDIARGIREAQYPVWTPRAGVTTWTLHVSGAEMIKTPDGHYQALKFRLGSEDEWIEGWSAPLLVFHFVKIVRWKDGRQVGELLLDEKQL